MPERLRVAFDGHVVADTLRGWRVLETSHPPTYYLPPDDIRQGALVPGGGGSVCEWKGRAAYFDVVGATRRAERAAWGYPAPTPAFGPIAGHVAFYAATMESCRVGEEVATPQPAASTAAGSRRGSSARSRAGLARWGGS